MKLVENTPICVWSSVDFRDGVKRTHAQYFLQNDGGREKAGYKGPAGDCVVRAIALATQIPYEKIYADLNECNKEYANSKLDDISWRIQLYGTSPRRGNYKKVYHKYLLEKLGWKWVPTMGIGSGCQTHLRGDELPNGRVIARCSKHLVAVIDGIINDVYDCSRQGSRCVYGYYIKT